MADKPVFVDMISEATRQTRRRIMPRVVAPEVKENLASQSLAAGPVAAVAHRDADAVETQILEVQGLGLRNQASTGG